MNKNGLSLTNYDIFDDSLNNLGFKQKFLFMPDRC